MTTTLYLLNLEIITISELTNGVGLYTAKVVNDLYKTHIMPLSVVEYDNKVNSYFSEV